MTQVDEKAIILDNGTYSCKAGFSGEDVPSTDLRTCIGYTDNDSFIGKALEDTTEIKNIKHPIERGLITSWEDMEKIWDYIFNKELQVEVKNHPILITESLKPAINQMNTMVEVMFEKFGAPSLHFTNHAVLSLYGTGRTSGLVVDCGEGVTKITPIYDEYKLPTPFDSYHLAGIDLTEYLQQLLVTKGVTNLTKSEIESVKEKFCSVALDAISDNEDTYILPDGRKVTLGSERELCTEALFQPHLVGKDLDGLPTASIKIIQNSNIDTRRDLYENIVLIGGSCSFINFRERFEKEVNHLIPRGTKVKVTSPHNKKYASWLGGSILSSLATSRGNWLTREQFKEFGNSILQRKYY